MKIRDYQHTDSTEIADLFHTAVHAIDDKLYNSHQREAWAPSPPNYHFWEERLALKKPFVAYTDEGIVGFIELEEDGHIDCLYVHKDYQGKGVAAGLLHYLCVVAKTQGIKQLYVEASAPAMLFFKKQGFSIQGKNAVELRGEVLENFSMSRGL